MNSFLNQSPNLRASTEEFQVLAVIEKIKELFVLPRFKKVRTQPGTSSHHLPEFRLPAHQFKENQINNFRDIDSSIEHIHRDGKMRGLFLVREIVYQALCVFCFESYDTGELTLEMRIIDIEPFGNKLSMSLVLGKKDSFPQAVTASNFQPPGHQVCQHFVYSINIE